MVIVKETNMKPYEEIDFPNGFLRWIREDGMYVCSMTEEQMEKIKALHEARQEPVAWINSKELLVMRGNAYAGAKNWRVNLGLVEEEGDVALYTIKEKNT